jgi:phosphoribosylaminoimidazolecarboxamide formyltransferase/IMP cyclohydrolase
VTQIPIKRALVSVYDKTGLEDLARALHEAGTEIVSTGSTAGRIEQAGIPVTKVEDLTGFPECLDGRVKTLHPRVHAGLLADLRLPAHSDQLKDLGIEPFQMLVSNLYPFTQTVASGAGDDEVIEQIDIGGPAMVRAASKNHASVAVVTSPDQYASAVKAAASGGFTLAERKRLAAAAFAHTAAYDAAVASWFAASYAPDETAAETGWPDVTAAVWRRQDALRYGENPHQSALFYRDRRVTEASMATAELLGGKELSYNNIVDGDAALEAVKELADAPAAAIVKHMNPCGYATGATLAQALEAAWSGDTVSAFGGVIAVTRAVDIDAAKVLAGRFVELLVAPGFTDEALEYLRQKSASLRILRTSGLADGIRETRVLKHVTGGMLWQDRDDAVFDRWETVTQAQFPENRERLAAFAYKACKHVKSNAIVLAQEYLPGFDRIVGMGAGQPNRVDSLRKLAVTKAAENIRADHEKRGEPPRRGTAPEFGEFVMASDAFFPFADTIDEANAAGIRYIVQPGGSKRDGEVVEACDKYGIAMAFTGMRHFRH